MELQAETKFINLFDTTHPLSLESGEKLNKVKVAYQTYGELNTEKSNAILICHALTGNAHAAGILKKEESDPESKPDLLKKYSQMFSGKPGWWDPLIGAGKLFDTNKYFVLCSNILGSCYGTTGPISINDTKNKAYQADFPQITVPDIVRVQKKLIDHLEINKLITVTGGSLGGMQALEWGIMYPEILNSIIPIGTSAKHSAWAIGIGEVERLAIKNDPRWNDGFYDEQPTKGLSLARQIAMLTYRSFPSFEEKFNREKTGGTDLFNVISYLDYQGNKLIERFDANTYLLLNDVMDQHDIGWKRGKTEKVLHDIKPKTLAIGISSDLLYPTAEQKFIAKNIPDAKYAEINSHHGHDAFLIEFDQLTEIIGEFLKTIKK